MRRTLPSLILMNVQIALALQLIASCLVCCSNGERLGSIIFDDSVGEWVYAVNISVVIERVKCYPDFETRVGHPSRVLTDFYGLQAIKNSATFSQVEAEMKRLGYKIIDSFFGYNITFSLLPSLNLSATFFFNTPILVKQGVPLISHNFAEILTPNCNYLNAVSAFRNLLQSSTFTRRNYNYLPINPYFNEEVEAEKILNGSLPVPPVKWIYVKEWKDVKRFGENVTVVVPDRVHQHDSQAYAAISAAINSTSIIDWVGLEMVGHTLQEALITYLTANANSEKYKKAYETLSSAMAPYYFKLVEMQRAAGRKIGYGLDGPLQYDFFRYGETDFGAAVRNLMWVKNMGAKGRGAIMGGSAHFSTRLAPVFAHALHDRNPSMVLLQFVLAG